MKLTPTRLVAAGFGTGYSPFAPGTAGTAAALPLAFALSLAPLGLRLAFLAALLPAAAWICGRAARQANVEDPGWIVLDEIVGFLVATALLAPGCAAYLVAFLLFRLFDILKPPPAGAIDRRMAGGWGILLDDVVAGLYTALSLALLERFGAL